MLKKNLIANYIGQGWAAFLNLAFIPIYIKYLGIEAYGLIGLYAVLQACLALLDLGMTPTLNRIMARFTGGAEPAQKILNLLRSVEWIVFFLTLSIGLGIYFSAAWISKEWLHAENLSLETAEQAVFIMGLVASFRFFESVYRSVIIGLQKQVLFNAVNGLLSTMRVVGAVAVLKWVSPTIDVFFIWQAFLSLVTVIILASLAYHSLPKTGSGSRFSIAVLRDECQFAGGVLGITFLALLLTQVDKVLLSKLLTLKEYGYYTLAAVMAGALFTITGPITQAWFPRLSELHAGNRQDELIENYHLGAQIVTVLVGSTAVVMFLFSEVIIDLWIADSVVTSKVSLLLSVLTVGNFLNCLMWIPYQAQLAYGWTNLGLRINLISVVVIIPGVLWAAPNYGALGVAYLWTLLNVGYLLVGVQFMYQRILINEKWRWYIQDIAYPLLASSLMALALKIILGKIKLPYQNEIVNLVIVSALTLFSGFVGAGKLRKILFKKLKQ